MSISNIIIVDSTNDSKLLLRTVKYNKYIARLVDICFGNNDFLLRVDKLFENLTYLTV